MFVAHHMIFDEWSSDVFIQNMVQFYQEQTTGVPVELPALRVQYPDVAAWQRDPAQRTRIPAQIERRMQHFDDGRLSPLQLPFDRPHPAVQTQRGASLHTTLSRDIHHALQRLGEQTNTTPYMILLTAFQALLYRITAQRQFEVAFPLANRPSSEFERLIGYFVNLTLFPANVRGQMRFSDVLARTRQIVLEAVADSDLPFAQLIQALNPRRHAGNLVIAEVIFNYIRPNRPAQILPGLVVESFDIDLPDAPYVLDVQVIQQDETLTCRFRYNTDRFNASTVERLSTYYQRLLSDALHHPEKQISELALLTESEFRQIIVEWNDTARPYPADQTIHALFADQARRTPGAVAVQYRDHRLTYAQLNDRADQCAVHLRPYVTTPETPVGLLMDRSPDLITAMLAVLKAGGAYVPLDPGYPAQRLAFMIEDTGIKLLITQPDLFTSVPALDNTKALTLDDLNVRLPSSAPGHAASTAESLAYIMYTSGSTGNPKGIEILHRNALRLVTNPDYVELGEDEVILQLAPVSFDAATFEIWGALLNGGRLVLYPEPHVDHDTLGRVIQEEGITTLWLTAGLFRLIVESRIESLRGLRQLLAGGDVLPVEHVNKALRHLGDQTRLINCYGPTENTTFSCCFPIRTEIAPAQSVPIGYPIANSTAYILDEALNPVPVGVAGDIYVGGDGLARGYRNRPDLTAERFIPHPFEPAPSARIYRTGDRAKYQPDGTIIFLGRTDSQVKISGYRIELGEVEAIIQHFPDVQEAVVVALPTEVGSYQLVGYVVGRPGCELTPDSLK